MTEYHSYEFSQSSVLVIQIDSSCFQNKVQTNLVCSCEWLYHRPYHRASVCRVGIRSL